MSGRAELKAQSQFREMAKILEFGVRGLRWSRADWIEQGCWIVLFDLFEAYACNFLRGLCRIWGGMCETLEWMKSRSECNDGPGEQEMDGLSA